MTALKRWVAHCLAGLDALTPWGHRFLWSAIGLACLAPLAHAEMVIKAPTALQIPPSIRFAQPLAPGPGRTPLPLAGSRASTPAVDPGQQCRRAVQQAGRTAGLPDHLMSAIARVESGRRGADGQVHPWPWSINVAGIDHIYDTKEQAIIAVRQYQAQAIRSIDVGCMQVNLLYHPEAFGSLEQAFDPLANATYAARFLLQLHAQSGSWAKATADYHSATPELGQPYQQKVMEVLPQETLADAKLPAQIGAPASPGGGLVRLPLRVSSSAAPARIVPMAAGTAQMVGRGLDAYRAAPVRLAARVIR